eukprot:tig00020537_g10231.t1
MDIVPVVGASCAQGMRPSMEDEHVVLVDLAQKFPDVNMPCSYFAVFDGHGGAECAQYMKTHLHANIIRSGSFRGDIPKAVKEAYTRTDRQFLDTLGKKGIECGSTAVTAILHGKTLVVANVGDSRAIMSRRGRAMDLTTDHKPALPLERQRIEAAGGWVRGNAVNGCLAVSRALGDIDFKDNATETFGQGFRGDLITADPDVHTYTLTDQDEFIVLACDGLYDVMSSQDVVDFVRRKLTEAGAKEAAKEAAARDREAAAAAAAAGSRGGARKFSDPAAMQASLLADRRKKTVSDLSTGPAAPPLSPPAAGKPSAPLASPSTGPAIAASPTLARVSGLPRTRSGSGSGSPMGRFSPGPAPSSGAPGPSSTSPPSPVRLPAIGPGLSLSSPKAPAPSLSPGARPAGAGNASSAPASPTSGGPRRLPHSMSEPSAANVLARALGGPPVATLSAAQRALASEPSSLQAVADALVREALRRHTMDNVSVLVIRLKPVVHENSYA